MKKERKEKKVLMEENEDQHGKFLEDVEPADKICSNIYFMLFVVVGFYRWCASCSPVGVAEVAILRELDDQFVTNRFVYLPPTSHFCQRHWKKNK
jgi:hypothetical protein